MSKNQEFYQQGDVLLVRVDAVPSNSKNKKDNIVAEGEVTGHMHRIHGAAVLEAEDEQLFVDAPDGAEITHDEHGKIDIDPGRYEVRIVREYDPFEDEIRSVED